MFVYMFGVTNRRFGPAPGGEASDITLSRRTASWRSLVRHSSMPPLLPTAGRSDPRDSKLGRFLRRTRPPPTVPARAVDEQIFRLILIAGVRDHHAGRHQSSRLEHDQRVGGP